MIYRMNHSILNLYPVQHTYVFALIRMLHVYHRLTLVLPLCALLNGVILSLFYIYALS